MKKNKICIAFILFAVLITASCLSTTQAKNPPEWLINTPKSDSQYEYFTASGSDTNPSEAEHKAIANLITEVTMYIGTSVESNSTAVISGQISNLKKQLENKLSRKSSAQLKEFKITKKHFINSGDDTIVYVLGQYKKSALEKEKQRLIQIAIEKENSHKQPKKVAAELYNKGYYQAAAKKYIEAAVMAKLNKVENAPLLFSKYIKNATGAIEKISQINIDIKQNNNSPLFVITGEPNTKLKLAYTAKYGNKSKKRIIYEYIEIPDTDKVEFTLPPTSVSGYLYCDIDATEILDELETIGADGKNAKKKLENRFSQKGKKLKYTFPKKNIPPRQSAKVEIISNSKTTDETTEALKHSLKLSIEQELQLQGYTLSALNPNLLLTVEIIPDKPELNDGIYFTAFKILLSVKNQNGETILSRNIQKRSTSLKKETAFDKIPSISAKLIVDALNTIK
ncbi:MAG: hypothetical protein CR988_06000 [Treponema sp.]|nr:MAG: hypothetical protein CR988_06000 [Treponema sp.]